MKVLLIAPHFAGYREQAAFLEPYGLCLLAAVLEQKGHHARIIHQLDPHRMSHEDIVQIAEEFEPDCIGFSTLSENYPIGLSLAKILRARMKAPIIFGGIHATYNPEIALEPSIDLVILGHAFHTLPEVLERLEDGCRNWDGISGVAFENEGELIVQEEKMLDDGFDLNSLPFPKRDDLPIGSYKIWPMLMLPPSRQRVLSLYTQWGCRYNCDFCLVHRIYGHRIFVRSSDLVLEEIELLAGKFGVNFIHFHDDDFRAEPDHMQAVCQGLIDKKLGIHFGMMTRLDHLDRDALDLLEEAGLIMLTLGIEAGTGAGLKNIHKGLTLDEIRSKLELTRNRKFQVNGTYMIGFPWESKQTIMNGYHFIQSLPLDSWSLNVLIPFKGLKIRETLEKEGLIADHDLARFSYKEVVVRTRHLSQRQLESIAYRLLVKYYFRPKFAWWIFRRMLHSPQMIRSTLEVFFWGMKRCMRLFLIFPMQRMLAGRRMRKQRV